MSYSGSGTVTRGKVLQVSALSNVSTLISQCVSKGTVGGFAGVLDLGRLKRQRPTLAHTGLPPLFRPDRCE